MTTDSPAPERLSINQETVRQLPLPEPVDACAELGISGVGLWRAPVREYGVERAAKTVRDAGLTVTTLCRGGFFTAADPAGRATANGFSRPIPSARLTARSRSSIPASTTRTGAASMPDRRSALAGVSAPAPDGGDVVLRELRPASILQLAAWPDTLPQLQAGLSEFLGAAAPPVGQARSDPNLPVAAVAPGRFLIAGAAPDLPARLEAALPSAEGAATARGYVKQQKTVEVQPSERVDVTFTLAPESK